MSKRARLGELLIGAGVIDDAQLSRALARQREIGRPLGQTLLEMGALDEETLIRTLARQLAVPMVWLRGKRIKPEVLAWLPWELVEKHRCLPVLIEADRTLMLATEDPTDPMVAEEVARASGLAVKTVLAAPSELEDAIARHAPADPELSVPSMEFVDDAPAPELLTVDRSPAETPPPSPASGTSTDRVLRALSQLLVEKGVLTRDELVARLRKLADEEG